MLEANENLIPANPEQLEWFFLFIVYENKLRTPAVLEAWAQKYGITRTTSALTSKQFYHSLQLQDFS
jgi:hypothetical protein